MGRPKEFWLSIGGAMNPPNVCVITKYALGNGFKAGHRDPETARPWTSQGFIPSGNLSDRNHIVADFDGCEPKQNKLAQVAKQHEIKSLFYHSTKGFPGYVARQVADKTDWAAEENMNKLSG